VTAPTLGALVQTYFLDHLIAMKGLRPSSVRSYRDTLRLFLLFTAKHRRSKVTRLTPQDLTFERVLAFLRHLEEVRGNHIRTRNQRLAALHSFFEFLATRSPELLAVAEKVAAIPSKRTAPAPTLFLEREQIDRLLKALPIRGRHALRDRALLLFLYNTGARVQEAASLRFSNLDLGEQPRVHLHGKGDKWRACPLWKQTADALLALRSQRGLPDDADAPIFASGDRPLTRFGIYKIVRRHAARFDPKDGAARRRITPHVFRHTTAVHLLESGVELNVIRGWLGHVSIATTSRYAEINTRMKEAALKQLEVPRVSEGFARTPAWRNDKALLTWLDSL
jgi:site-specific recombinase XerD